MLFKLFFLAITLHLLQAKDLPKSDKPSDVVVHATNNTAVPSVHYVVDAIECLKEAYTVYAEPQATAELYAELFQEKHNETEWSVVAGYTAAYVKSKYYVEATVTNGGKNKKDSKDKDTLYLIFSSV